MASFILTYLLSYYFMKLPTNPLYIPPEDSDVNFPHLEQQTIGRNEMEFVSYLIHTGIIILLRLLAKLLPNTFRRFNTFPAIWAQLSCVCLADASANFLKGYVGRARPDTYQVCGYNTTFGTCNAKQKAANKQFLSWPSNHASFAMSGATFMTLFVQNTIANGHFCITVASTSFMLYGCYIGATRIRDFKHHTDDVTAGTVLGFIFGTTFFKALQQRLFEKREVAEVEVALVQGDVAVEI